jgi:hypothetical protein
VARLASYLVLTVVLLALPLVVLVRLSVFLYEGFPLGAWPSLAIGAFGTFVLLTLYAILVRLRIQRRLGIPKPIRRFLLAVVGAYCAYALLFLSSANAKTEEVRSLYVSLNPLIRVATSSLLLMDREAVITDVRRTREDYIRWGLPPNEASLHFEQPNGFVHAVDLRTLGRPEWRNRAVRLYFQAMGFYTLRHVGTADHLHVSLALSEAGEPSSPGTAALPSLVDDRLPPHQRSLEEIVRGAERNQPALVDEEVVHVVGEDDELEGHLVGPERLHEAHGLAEGHVPVIIAVNEEHG